MSFTPSTKQSFYAIGLSYEKANAQVRGKFSLDKSAQKALMTSAKANGQDALIALSTCNRTELYGFAANPFHLIKLLCDHTQGSLDEFEKVAFVCKGQQAINHIFHVGSGLDSQILGDFEIIGQLKKAFVQAKSAKMTNAFLERLTNSVIQASKRIKTETGISSGATSVSFASVQYILNKINGVSKKNITLFGTGKIGRNTVENLVKHINNKNITLINRTKNKAEEVALKHDLIVKDYADLQVELRHTDILIVATGAQKPTVSREIIHTEKPIHILDLSIPKNVSDDVKSLPNVNLIHLDHLSAMTDKTLSERRTYIPEAKAIIEEVKQDFYDWQETRKFVPTIKALKEKLSTIKEVEIASQEKKCSDFDHDQADLIGNRIVQKIMNKFAVHLREDQTGEGIELLQHIFQLEDLNNS